MEYTEKGAPESLRLMLRLSTSYTEFAALCRIDIKHIKKLQSIIEFYHMSTKHFRKECEVSKGYTVNYETTKECLIIKTKTKKRKPISFTDRMKILTETKYCCEKCKNRLWQGIALDLHIHHLDGNPLNNSRNNLQALCPNCHSQTDNFMSKNLKRASKTTDELRKEYNFP